MDNDLKANLVRKLRNETFKFEKDGKDFLEFFKTCMESESDIINETSDMHKVFQIIVPDIDMEFWIEFDRGQVSYDIGTRSNPTLILTMNESILLKIITNQSDGSVLFMEGTLGLKGKASDAYFFNKMIGYCAMVLLG